MPSRTKTLEYLNTHFEVLNLHSSGKKFLSFLPQHCYLLNIKSLNKTIKLGTYLGQ
jgi:hypothetical protein